MSEMVQQTSNLVHVLCKELCLERYVLDSADQNHCICDDLLGPRQLPIKMTELAIDGIFMDLFRFSRKLHHATLLTYANEERERRRCEVVV
jgi:hypothetical protein